MTRPATFGKAGFTVIEMLVSIALLGVISSALVAFLPTIVSMNRQSNEEQQVTVDAKRAFETLRAEWAGDANAFDNETLGSVGLSSYLNSETAGRCTGAVVGSGQADGGFVSSSPPTSDTTLRKQVTLTCDGLPFVLELGRP